ncbi:MAG: hypothetical protein U1F24_14755 [Alphaproteobacteria bacterium]
MFTRILAGALALFHGLNAAAMIAAPGDWYAATPGVPLTGPFNPHFVVDIGFAFLVAAAGFAAYAIRPALGWGVAAMAAAWPGLHALFHVVHIHDAPAASAALEAGGVIVPGALGLFAAWRAALTQGRP